MKKKYSSYSILRTPGERFNTLHFEKRRRHWGRGLWRNNLVPRVFSTLQNGSVTMIWVSLCFGYFRTQIPSVLGIPGTQNTESIKLGQVKSSTILLKIHLSSHEALSQ